MLLSLDIFSRKVASFEFLTLLEKCPYSEFFWSVFSRIRTEYGPENSEYGHFSRSVNWKTCILWGKMRALLKNELAFNTETGSIEVVSIEE